MGGSQSSPARLPASGRHPATSRRSFPAFADADRTSQDPRFPLHDRNHTIGVQYLPPSLCAGCRAKLPDPHKLPLTFCQNLFAAPFTRGQ